MARNPLEARSSERPPVLLHAPTGCDRVLVAELLTGNGIAVAAVDSMAALDRRLDDGIGTILIAGEAISPEAARRLRERLDAQPSWSDLSLTILTARGPGGRISGAAIDTLREEINVTLLERPVQPLTLLSAVRSALRARVRQYQVRDYLAERAEAEENSRRMQRLDAVGKLAGGVAHEVNNMMTVVLGFGEFALNRIGPAHPARADIEEIVRAGERAATITQQLLAFTRQQHNTPTVLSLSTVAQELSTLLSKLLGAEYRLQLELPDDLPLVRVDRTQMGLSTAYGIVKQNEGYIWLYSEPGIGTTVKIYLPALTDPAAARSGPRPTATGGSERILVVEDEAMVRGLARRALESQGYQVLSAASGVEALELLARTGPSVDLVLCDLVMPDMNGYELGQRLATEAPGMPVLYMSGYLGPDAALHGLLPPEAEFIQKPFTPDGLGAGVRTALETPATARARV